MIFVRSGVRLACLATIVLAFAAGVVRGEAPQMLARNGVRDITAIVKDNEANAVIVRPSNDRAYGPLVESIISSVRQKTGIELPVRSVDQVLAGRFLIDDAYKKQNLILLGNLNVNPALVQLGALAHVYATSEWPGPNGYELRTITNPFGTRANCLVLAGSGPDQVKLAALDFVAQVEALEAGPDLIVPRLCRIVRNGEDQTSSAAKPIGDRGPFDGTYRVAAVIEQYQRSGSTAQLEAVQTVLRAYLEANDPPAAADYGTESAVRALDLVDSFALSDNENLKMDGLLLNWVLKIIEERPYWNAQGRNWSFGGHQACGALSFLAVTDYLLKNGTPNEAARALLREQQDATRAYMRYFSTSFKDAQKDVGWETWTPLAAIGRYALVEQDLTCFEQGVVTNVIRRHFYADKGFGPAAVAGFVHNDGRYRTLAPEGGTISGWAYVLSGPTWVTARDIEPAEPDFLIGTHLMPASPTDWEHAHGADPTTAQWYTPLPHDKTFHLIGFTDGIAATDTMLVLGGWDARGNPGEANSIRVFRQDGHRHLFRADGNDNRKPRPGRFYQNSIVVESADYTAAPPCAAELRARVDLPGGGMTASRLSDYHGVDWDRHVFWRRGQFFAVIDVCRTRDDRPVRITNQWWNLDAPRLSGDRWTAQTRTGTFNLVMADPGNVSGRQWRNGGPHQLRQVKVLNGPGAVTYINLFYVDKPDAPLRLELRQVDPSTVLVRDTVYEGNGGSDPRDVVALIGYRHGDEKFSAGSVQVDADPFFVSPSLIMLSGDGDLHVGGAPLASRPDGTLQTDDAQRVRRVLLELWDEAAEPAAPREMPLLAQTDETIELKGRRSTEMETGYEPIAGTRFEQEENGAITWDLGGPQKVTRIEGIRLTGPAVNVRYGDDALAEDSPVVTAVTRLEKQWVYYQYGFAASLGIQTLGPLNVSGRYFRVEVPGSNLEHGRWIHQDWHSQSWNVTGHNPELFNRPFWQDVVFRSDRPDIRITHKTAADLDSDGNDELVFATDRNELLVLAADGSVRWKYKLGAPVTGLICEDLKGDASRQVLCTTHDTALHMFSHDGKTHTRIDKLPASGLNSLGLYVEPSGDRGLFVGTYHHPMKLDAAGDALTTASGSGFYQDTMPDVSWDLTGDGVPDLVLRENVWGLVSLIDGAKFSALASHSTRHLGRGLGVVPWPVRGSSRVNRFLVIAESGLAMLEATGEAGEPLFGDAATVVGGIRSVFSIPIAPVVAWSVADLDGDGAREIVVASLNGAVMVFDGTGRTIASTIAAGEVSDLAVLERGDNPSMIVTATNAGLRRFDADLKLVSDGGPQTANCRAIGAVRANGHHIALCLFANGDVARLVE